MNSKTEIAEIAHEAKRTYCRSLGDYSQYPWSTCPQWQRDTVLNGVLAISRNIVTEPGQSHENWLKFKEEQGWSHGPEKDERLKTHPYMIPFDELTAEQQMKDRLFFAIVTILLG